MIFSPDHHASAKALYDAVSGRWLTYADLQNEVAALQPSLNAASKSLVFNFCRNDLRSIATYLASLEANNAATALLDDGLVPEAKTSLIELYRPDFISTGVEVPHPDYEQAGDSLWRKITPDTTPLHPDLALLLSTSGSTGSPRFVRLTRRNVEANAESISAVLEIGHADCAITSLPIHYSYGLSVLNTHLLRGASLALTNQGLLEPGFWETFLQRGMHLVRRRPVPLSDFAAARS